MADIQKSLAALKSTIEPKRILVSGMLGIPIDGAKTVNVANRPGYVYVRLRGNTSELIQAYNDQVSPVYDLPVFVERDETKYVVTGRNIAQYTEWGSSAYLPYHGNTHSLNGVGGDITWVYSPQFMPLGVFPSGSSVQIYPYIYNWNGDWRIGGQTGTPDLSAYLPTDNTKQSVLLLYIDGVSSNPSILEGTEAPLGYTDAGDLIPYLPSFSPSQGLPLAMILMPSGTSSLDWGNIYDLRQFFWNGVSGSSGGIGEAPTDGFVYGRKNGSWVNVSGSSGLDDAPSDGYAYGRKDGTWQDVLEPGPIDGLVHAQKNGAWYQFVPMDEAPINGTPYARQDTSWVSISGSSGGVEEAPIDGIRYLRKDANWVSFPTGTGGGDVYGTNETGTNGHLAVFDGDGYHLMDGGIVPSGGLPEGYFNVKDYGALGDDSHNDTSNIQAALDVATVIGGVVYFPPGTYLSGSLTLYPNVSLIGTERDICIIKANSAITLMSLQETATLTEFTGIIQDLTLDGNSLTGTIGLDLRGIFRLVVNRVKIKQFSSIGLKLRGVLISKFYDCEIVSNATGVNADLSTLSITGLVQSNLDYFLNCRISWNTTYGVYWKGGTSIQFKSCDMSANGTAGNGATGGIYIKPVGDGIGLISSDCWFELNYGGYVIFIDTPDTNSPYNFIENATIHLGSVSKGVVASGANVVICRGVTFGTDYADGDFYANAGAYIVLDSCFGTLGAGAGTIDLAGNVKGDATVTDGHLAVFDVDGYHIKDGGAVPSAGVTDASNLTYTPSVYANWTGSSDPGNANGAFDQLAGRVKDIEDAVPGGGDVATDTLWDAKGDLAVGTSANTASRLPVGVNGQFLKAASGEVTGLLWDTPAGAGDFVGPTGSTDGHLVVFDGTTGKLGKDGGAVPAGSGTYGWNAIAGTFTYASPTTINISAGGSGIYSVGDKIRFQNNDSGTYLYAYIITVADTLLTVIGNTVPNATLTDAYFSKVATPLGFPGYFAFTPTIVGGGGGTAPTYTDIYCYFSISGRLCHVSVSLVNSAGGTAGSGANTLLINAPITLAQTNIGVGSGMSYESGGTLRGIFVRVYDASNFYFHTYDMTNIVLNDQSSAARQLKFNMDYYI